MNTRSKVSYKVKDEFETDDVEYDHILDFEFVEENENGNQSEDEQRCGKGFVFSKEYERRFNILLKTYGALLQHQSDRNLPRTHIASSYMSTKAKNANEMTGLFI